jgi:hypothetical protein
VSAPALERARRYLAQMPAAISGSGGHVAAFRAAAVLTRGFKLSVDDATTLLREDYNPRCQPPWTEAELRHKVEDAAKADKIPLGYLLDKGKRGAGRSGKSKKASSPAVYKVQDGCLFRNTERLTNFSAAIDEEVLTVGAGEAARSYKLSGALSDGTPLAPVTVPVAQFAKMDWVADRWGARAIVEPGRNAAEKVRVAIQTLSSPTMNNIYTGYGWHEVGGKPIYLLPGPHLPAGIEIEHEACSYTLEGDGGVVDAYRVALDMLQVAPLEVTAPLVGMTFLAPFSTALEVDFSLWLSGKSGSRKSSMAALLLSFFGRFTLRNLPANFLGTATFLEARLHELKDTLCVVDNFIPPQTARDGQDQTSKAVRIIQAIGDRSSRGRCRRDASVQPRRDPQGAVIFTGERLPAENESTLGRFVLIPFTMQTVDLHRLSDIQARTNLLRVAMRHAIGRASVRFDEAAAELRARRDRLAVDLSTRLVGAHGRTPGAIASLVAGYELMLAIAVEVGAATEEDAAGLRARGLEALVQLGLAQPKAEVVSPADFYVKTVRAMIAQGTRVLVAEHEALNCTKTVGEHEVEVKNAIGWRSHDQVWLLPELAWHAIVEFHRGNLPYSKTDAHRGLADQGILIDRDEEGQGRFTARRSPAGKRERVLVLPRGAIEELDPEAASGPASSNAVDYLHLLDAV